MSPLQLGNINILVGENNSGKSTFTKAALLLANFLKFEDGSIDRENQNNPQGKVFSFKEEKFKNVYIDTFYQALCTKSDNGLIKFNCCLDSFDISICVAEPSVFHKTRQYKEFFRTNKGPYYDYEEWSSIFPLIREEDPHLFKAELSKEEASVSRIEIIDRENAVHFLIDYENSHVLFSYFDQALGKELNSIDESLSACGTDSKEYYALIRRRYEIIDAARCSVPSYRDFLGSEYSIESLIEKYKEQLTDDKSKRVSDSYLSMKDTLAAFEVEYIYAHSVHQLSSYRFDTSFSNDYVDQTISRFQIARMKFGKGLNAGITDPYMFVKEWMQRFGIGDDFVIFGGCDGCDAGSERVHVKIMDGDEEQDLSAKGIGAIQLFILILRIATIICRNSSTKTIIIEEPEQNLHPALQSRLADFFLEVSESTGCQFIIETHSEYMVRRSQVLVSELDDFSKNPFKVFYFPHVGAPYNMRFKPSGRFVDRFGEGFFDEAGKMHLQLLDKEQTR